MAFERPGWARRGGLNSYGHAGGDPINFYDPNGLEPWWVGLDESGVLNDVSGFGVGVLDNIPLYAGMPGGPTLGSVVKWTGISGCSSEGGELAGNIAGGLVLAGEGLASLAGRGGAKALALGVARNPATGEAMLKPFARQVGALTFEEFATSTQGTSQDRIFEAMQKADSIHFNLAELGSHAENLASAELGPELPASAILRGSMPRSGAMSHSWLRQLFTLGFEQ